MTHRSRPAARLAAVVAPLALLGAAATQSTLSTVAHSAGSRPAAQLLGRVPTTAAARAQLSAPRAVAGTHRLVTLRTDLLPERAAGQPVGFAVAPGRSVTGRVARVVHTSTYTAWTGPLDTKLGTFTLVKVGSLYRGELISPAGVFAITRAAGDRYWVTEVAPWHGASGDDTLTPRPTAGDLRWADTARRTLARRALAARGHHKAKIKVMFGYTTKAKKIAGGRAGIKADAALAVSDTNKALSNSHIAVRVRLAGVVHTRNKETTKVFTDVRRLYLPRDGHFDGLLKQKRRHHADVVHLLTAGSRFKLCGAGYEPINRRSARPSLGVSVSFVKCLPYIVATHELGHNMGADHIKYRGVSHDSKLPYAYGHINVKGRYLTVMGYYDPCSDKNIYDCVRIPYYSSPRGHYHGGSLGNRRQNNAKAIRQIAPLVARYAH